MKAGATNVLCKITTCEYLDNEQKYDGNLLILKYSDSIFVVEYSYSLNKFAIDFDYISFFDDSSTIMMASEFIIGKNVVVKVDAGEYVFFRKVFKECQRIVELYLRLQIIGRDFYYAGTNTRSQHMSSEVFQNELLDLREKTDSAQFRQCLTKKKDVRKITSSIIQSPLNGSGLHYMCIYCSITSKNSNKMDFIEHPYVRHRYGGEILFLCSPCLDNWKSYRNVAIHGKELILPGETNEELCAVCSCNPDELTLCSGCPRSYCSGCLDKVMQGEEKSKMTLMDDWKCMACCKEYPDTCSSTKASLGSIASPKAVDGRAKAKEPGGGSRKRISAPMSSTKTGPGSKCVSGPKIFSVSGSKSFSGSKSISGSKSSSGPKIKRPRLSISADSSEIIPDVSVEINPQRCSGRIPRPSFRKLGLSHAISATVFLAANRTASNRDEDIDAAESESNCSEDVPTDICNGDESMSIELEVGADPYAFPLHLSCNKTRRAVAVGSTDVISLSEEQHDVTTTTTTTHIDNSEVYFDGIPSTCKSSELQEEKIYSLGDSTASTAVEPGLVSILEDTAVCSKQNTMSEDVMSSVSGSTSSATETSSLSTPSTLVTLNSTTVPTSVPPVSSAETFYFGQYVRMYESIVLNAKKGDSLTTEDSCFLCKDGGELMECDCNRDSTVLNRHCRKVYHPDCLGYKVGDDETWLCPRHYCDSCGEKDVEYVCKYCPHSLCGRKKCISSSYPVNHFIRFVTTRKLPFIEEFDTSEKSMICTTCIDLIARAQTCGDLPHQWNIGEFKEFKIAKKRTNFKKRHSVLMTPYKGDASSHIGLENREVDLQSDDDEFSGVASTIDSNQMPSTLVQPEDRNNKRKLSNRDSNGAHVSEDGNYDDEMQCKQCACINTGSSPTSKTLSVETKCQSIDTYMALNTGDTSDHISKLYSETANGKMCGADGLPRMVVEDKNESDSSMELLSTSLYDQGSVPGYKSTGTSGADVVVMLLPSSESNHFDKDFSSSIPHERGVEVLKGHNVLENDPLVKASMSSKDIVKDIIQSSNLTQSIDESQLAHMAVSMVNPSQSQTSIDHTLQDPVVNVDGKHIHVQHLHHLLLSDTRGDGMSGLSLSEFVNQPSYYRPLSESIYLNQTSANVKPKCNLQSTTALSQSNKSNLQQPCHDASMRNPPIYGQVQYYTKQYARQPSDVSESVGNAQEMSQYVVQPSDISESVGNAQDYNKFSRPPFAVSQRPRILHPFDQYPRQPSSVNQLERNPQFYNPYEGQPSSVSVSHFASENRMLSHNLGPFTSTAHPACTALVPRIRPKKATFKDRVPVPQTPHASLTKALTRIHTTSIHPVLPDRGYSLAISTQYQPTDCTNVRSTITVKPTAQPQAAHSDCRGNSASLQQQDKESSSQATRVLSIGPATHPQATHSDWGGNSLSLQRQVESVREAAHGTNNRQL